jgi:long-chain acyl-CoA synthetase
MTAELKAARGGVFRAGELPHSSSGGWFEDLNIADFGSNSLGCDSLEFIGLAAATNEMFHLANANLDVEVFSARTFGDWLDIIEAGWRAGIVRITFRTSGSTGIPKRCTHEFPYLRTEVSYLANMFNAERRVVALVAAHHIYGFLFTAMLPDRLGLEVASDMRTDRGVLSQQSMNGDLIVSISERWELLDRTFSTWPKDVEGVVSTAPCSRSLLSSLMERGLRGMTEVYGSTETAGIGTRTWPEDTYRLMPQWQYGATSDRGRSSLTHSSGKLVQLMDRIHFRENEQFELAGRLDGSVQVGGTNVFPERIAALLVSLPGVAGAAVRLMRPEEGMRMKALIVPDSESSGEDLRPELETWIETHLPAVERPKVLTFVPAITMDSFGRALDW